MEPWEVTAWKAQGELVVAGQSMMCPAWCVLDVSPLWGPAAQRGQNLLIPGRPGKIGMPRRRDETGFSLPMLIDCTVDRTGAPWASIPVGLAGNLAYLESNVSGPVSTGDGTRTVTLGALSGPAQVSLVLGEQVGMLRRAVLTLLFPSGGLS